MWRTKINSQSIMRSLGYQIANPIDVMDSRRNPLICVAPTFNNRPDVVFIKVLDEQKIFTKCFKSNSAPNIMLRFRMTVRSEKRIESVFM